jgi:Flp pilus assembly protein TadG
MVMNKLRNDSGSVIVFITLMIVLLMVMVGMGLDTGYLTFSRNMGQRAVDMAALAGAAGLAQNNVTAIETNIEQLNATNDYVKSSGNQIDGAVNSVTGVGKNVTLVQYDTKTSTVVAAPVPLSSANAVRVALETTNPYSGASSISAINTPAFLTPLMNLFGGGVSAAGANKVNVSAISTMQALPGLPIALNGCDPAWVGTNATVPWNQSPTPSNNSGWTTYLDNSVSVPDIQALIHKVAACQGTGGVNVGSEICLNNGQQTPDLRELEILIGNNPDGTPKCYLTPVVPSTVTNFNGCGDGIPNNQAGNEILAYAQLCPLAVCGPGVNGNINQTLCDTTKTSPDKKRIIANIKSCNVGDLTVSGLGACYSLRLVRESKAGM